MADPKDIKYVLGNQDVDTSFITLEMTWNGIGTEEVEQHAGTPTLESFAEIIKGKTINFYVDSQRFKPFVSACAKSLINNKELLQNLESETIDITDKIMKLATNHIDQVNNLTDNEIITLLSQIKKLQAKAMTLGSAVAFADIFGEVTNGMLAVLKNHPNLKHDMTAYTHVLGCPAESLTEKTYKEIRSSNKNNTILAERYFWLDQGYIGRGLTPDHIQEIKTELRDEEDYPPAQELRDELNLTPDEQRLFEVSASLIKIKSLRADSRQFLHVLTNKIIDRIAQKLKINPKHLEALYTEEICDVLIGNPIPQDIGNRWKHSVVIPSKEEYEFLTGEAADKFLKERLLKEEIEEKESVKGQVAQPGKVKGRARLVFGPQHNAKVKDGEVLISRATSPQVLPAMKRAIAFVTDVGGITSHAAIVSREMKKPCIVGTQHATEIFHDGDLVEVDADEGIVKKIDE
ncbi:PEP-utilizing enzyme [Nanoarchaeota archaeon]